MHEYKKIIIIHATPELTFLKTGSIQYNFLKMTSVRNFHFEVCSLHHLTNIHLTTLTTCHNSH